MSKLRMFKVGELCVHKGYICRVEKVERNIAKGLFGVKDGTEFNPILTMTPLYKPDGEPVKKAKSKQDASGAVSRVSEEMADIEKQVALLQKRLNLLRQP